jgi:hypothetical protein
MPTNVWHLKIDLSQIWQSGLLDFDEKRDRIVEVIKASDWRALTPYPDTFDEYVANVEKSEHVGEFDAAFDVLYELADSDRVWIETH